VRPCEGNARSANIPPPSAAQINHDLPDDELSLDDELSEELELDGAVVEGAAEDESALSLELGAAVVEAAAELAAAVVDAA
jgi:hypothetical protein